MSLSTDKNAAMVLSGKMPDMLFPTVGKDAEEERKELKLAYPGFIPGKKQRIKATDRDVYQYYMAAASHFEEQKALAVNIIRRLMGDAQFGYTGRLIFVERRRTPVDEHKVRATIVDALYPVRN